MRGAPCLVSSPLPRSAADSLRPISYLNSGLGDGDVESCIQERGWSSIRTLGYILKLGLVSIHKKPRSPPFFPRKPFQFLPTSPWPSFEVLQLLAQYACLSYLQLTYHSAVTSQNDIYISDKTFQMRAHLRVLQLSMCNSSTRSIPLLSTLS